MAGRRVELGFEGATVLTLTMDDAAVHELTDALPSADGWRALTAEEGSYWINLGELVYVRLLPGEVSRVGFGGR